MNKTKILCNFFAMFLGCICNCSRLEASVWHIAAVPCADEDNFSSQRTPDETWVSRFDFDFPERLHTLSVAGNGEEPGLVMDFFRMGRFRNYFTSIGICSNRLDIAASEYGTIVSTNIPFFVDMNLVAKIRRELPGYRYDRHAGMSGGYVRLAVVADGKITTSGWFDEPWWPESKDEEFTSSLLYRRKTKDEDVWRLFHRVYRSVAPMAGSFIRAMDARHWPPVDYAKLLGPFPEWPKNRGDLRYEEGDGVIKLMNVAPYRPVKHFSVALALYAGNGDDYDIVFKINKKLEDRWSVAGTGSLSVVLDAESQEYHAHNEVSNGVSVKWTDLASEHVDGCAGNGYSNCARHRVTVRYDSYYADFYFERAVIN